MPRPTGTQSSEFQLSNPRPKPSGYGPHELTVAYNLPTADPGLATGKGGDGPVVAIVDAFSSATAENDLKVYREHFKLGTCTIANGCLRILNQTGDTSTPKPDPEPTSGWGSEIALDLDMVSAICPRCKILLIETNTNDVQDLAEGVREAIKLGAHIVSNSYGGAEPESDYIASAYKADHVVITASSGDDGTAIPVRNDQGRVVGTTLELPAGYPGVVAVGGTSLYFGSDNIPMEYAWSGSGGGCSRYVPKPSWQHDHDPDNPNVGCLGRTMNDVSAVADPDSGVSIYYTGSSDDAFNGWQEYGGTSAAAPIIAAIYGLAGNAQSISNAPQYIWTHGGDPHYFNPITAGSDGHDCALAYICYAGNGYSGVTGWGTPNGLGAF